MKVFLLFLALTSASAFGADEEITVSARRIPGEKFMPVLTRSFVDVGRGGKGGGTGGGTGGGAASVEGISAPSHTEPSNTELMSYAAQVLGNVLQQMTAMQAYGELTVKIETPKGFKFELTIKAGYGKADIIGKKKL